MTNPNILHRANEDDRAAPVPQGEVVDYRSGKDDSEQRQREAPFLDPKANLDALKKGAIQVPLGILSEIAGYALAGAILYLLFFVFGC
jgi:hypothetical protein